MPEYRQLTFAPCTITDLPELLVLEETCFRMDQPYRKNLDRYFSSPVGFCLCAYLEKRPVGYVLLVFTPKMKTVAINAIAVHPRLHNQGIAKKLLKKTFAAVAQKGATQIYCDVSFKNEAASALLLDAGFIETFDDPVLLPSSLDGTRLVMRLSEENIPSEQMLDEHEIELNVFNAEYFNILRARA